MVEIGGYCNICNKQNYCGCLSCKKENKGKLLWEWVDDIMVCGNCKKVLPGQ